MNCELCGLPISTTVPERISYYDLEAIAANTGYTSRGWLRLKKIFSRLQSGGLSNLTTWNSCAGCHQLVRGLLGGQSEYAPTNYSGQASSFAVKQALGILNARDG